MTREENAPTVDHRHPELVSISLRIVGTARHAAQETGAPIDRLVDAAAQALFLSDLGEHRNVAVQGISAACEVPTADLLPIYDADLPAASPATLKKLPDYLPSPEFDLEHLMDAVVRFEACHHVNLVKKFVTQYVSRQDPRTLNRSAEELFAYGYIGLSNALRGYDPSTNTISTFANFRVVGAVRDGVRSESPVPKRLTTFVRAVETAEEKLTRALSRVPTQDEVRAALGDQARYLHLYPRLCVQASLEELTSFNPISEQDVAGTVELEQAGSDLRAELQDLTEVEQVAVQLIHGEGLSARMAAKESGFPQGELTKAAESALTKLRQSPRIAQWENLVAA